MSHHVTHLVVYRSLGDGHRLCIVSLCLCLFHGLDHANHCTDWTVVVDSWMKGVVHRWLVSLEVLHRL